MIMMNSFKETDDTYVAHTYGRFPVELVSGKGSILKDINGKEYIDLGSGIGVSAFGAADDAWQKAVTDQIAKIQHTSNLYYSEPCALLAKALCERTGMKKVFFSNSGAEANECAIKAARKYSQEKKGEEYYNIITLEMSFHGRTLTCLAANGQDAFHRLYQPLTPGFVHVPAGDAAAMEKCVAENKTGGIMIECVQGEGGVTKLDPSYVKAVERIAKENDIPFIVDEVQTGNGRSGYLYSYMGFGIEPDIVSTAKGLSGGLPLGATMLGEKVRDIFSPGDHGSTFGGNPTSCAAALSVISRIDDSLLEEVRQKSAYVFETLKGSEGIEAVTGMGLMIGIKPSKRTAGEIVTSCIERGVLPLTAKDKIRLLPALNIPSDELKEAVGIIKEECAKQ